MSSNFCCCCCFVVVFSFLTHFTFFPLRSMISFFVLIFLLWSLQMINDRLILYQSSRVSNEILAKNDTGKDKEQEEQEEQKKEDDEIGWFVTMYCQSSA